MRLRPMPGVRVTYDPLVPGELINGILDHVQENIDILPAWLLSLYVMWDTDQAPGCTAAIEPNLAYRRAALRIGPKWPENNEAYRREVIIHEALHAHTWPLVALAHEMADVIEKNYDAPVLAARLREQIREATEQSTTDLTELVMRLIKRGDYPASGDGGALETVPTERDGPPNTPHQQRRSHAQSDPSTT